MQTIKQDRPRKYVLSLLPHLLFHPNQNFLSFSYIFLQFFFNICLFTFNYLTIRNESTLRLELLAIGWRVEIEKKTQYFAMKILDVME